MPVSSPRPARAPLGIASLAIALLAGCGDASPTGVPDAPTRPSVHGVVPAPAPAFAIVAQVDGAADPRLAGAVGRAVQRWERALATDLPDVTDTIAPGQCGANVPGFAGTIDDLHVFVVVDSIDGPGRALAAAGPCALRSPTMLPYVGVVTLDRADLPALLAVGLIDDLLAHELGHVLGVGVLWRSVPGRELLADAVAGDPRFTGAAAMEAAGRLGFHEEAARGIAVETAGGAGVAGVHWCERRYARELMTGFLNGTGNPLGLVTILSLRDLGYGVTETAAEPWSARNLTGAPAEDEVGALRAAAAGDAVEPRLEERVMRPAWTLDRGGRKRRLAPR